MGASNGTSTVSADDFRKAFSSVKPLILEEWPSVDPGALDATSGDFDSVATLVAEKTDRTKVAVKRHLSELHHMSSSFPQNQIDKLISAFQRLESRSEDFVKQVRTEMLPKAQEKVRQNLLVSLLVAIGLGFVLGFLMRGAARKSDV